MELNFPSNSYKDREPEESPTGRKPETAAKPVVTGKVSRQKMAFGKQLKRAVLGQDIKGIVEHVVMDVMIPAARDMMFDTLMHGAKQAIYGDREPTRPFPTARQVFSGNVVSGGNSAVQYHRMGPGSRREEDRPPGISRRGRQDHNFQEVVFQLEEDAKLVLEQLYRILEKYDAVKVADLYRLVDIKDDWTDNEWGWTSLWNTKIVPVNRGEGWIIEFPPTRFIRNDDNNNR